jgi:hypothetical protein
VNREPPRAVYAVYVARKLIAKVETMTTFDAGSYSDAELAGVFDEIFPNGFSGADVLAELAPAGWEHSPLLAVFHPSVEQIFEESVRMHRNISKLRKPNDERPESPEPTIDEIARDYKSSPIETDRELRELVGQCLWDVFSDSHEVVGPDGRVLDLGSFRGSGGFLADTLNRQIGAVRYDYLDFYMGTIWIADRADLTPVYQMIFRRLKSRGLDWVYHFPKTHAIDLRPLRESLDTTLQPDWHGYSPSAALAKEVEEKEREKNLTELRESLDEAYREEVEQALSLPPPATVRAYESVFGRLPRGWPPRP